MKASELIQKLQGAILLWGDNEVLVQDCEFDLMEIDCVLDGSVAGKGVIVIEADEVVVDGPSMVGVNGKEVPYGTLEPMGRAKWVDAKTKLPPVGEWVLVNYPRGEHISVMGYLVEAPNKWMVLNPESDEGQMWEVPDPQLKDEEPEYYAEDKVSHWAPLPPLPERKRGESGSSTIV